MKGRILENGRTATLLDASSQIEDRYAFQSATFRLASPICTVRFDFEQDVSIFMFPDDIAHAFALAFFSSSCTLFKKSLDTCQQLTAKSGEYHCILNKGFLVLAGSIDGGSLRRLLLSSSQC